MAKSPELFELFQPRSRRKSKTATCDETGRRRRAHGEVNDSARSVAVVSRRRGVPSRARQATGSESASELLDDQPVLRAEPIVESAEEECEAPQTRDAQQPLRRAVGGSPRVIKLKLEEAAIFGVGTVTLLVLAFLLGRYSGTTVEAAGPVEPAPQNQQADNAQDPIELRKRKALQTVEEQLRSPTYVQPRQTSTPAAQQPSGPYTIWLLKHREHAVAKIQQQKLEDKGFKHVRLHRDGSGVWIYVGSYQGTGDPRAIEDLRKLKAMSRAFRHAEIRKPRG